MMQILKNIDRMIGCLTKYLSIAFLLALLLLLGLSVLLRLLPLFTISGYDEVVELLFIWLVVLTTVALWREGVLYRVSLLENMLPQSGKLILSVLINLAMLGFSLMLTYYGWAFAVGAAETTPFLRISKIYWYAAIPVGGAFMSIYSVVWLWRVIWQRATLNEDSTLIG